METFASQSKVWIYQSDRFFKKDEEEVISSMLHTFIQNWHAHNQKLKASYEIKYHLFIVFIVDESETSASGCSIDSSVRVIKEIQENFGLNFFNRTLIAFKEKDLISLCSMSEFQEKITSNQITKETIVFNNLVPTLEAYNIEWEIQAKNSWHQKVFQFN